MHSNTPRARRSLRPSLESCEPRTLLSTGVMGPAEVSPLTAAEALEAGAAGTTGASQGAALNGARLSPAVRTASGVVARAFASGLRSYVEPLQFGTTILQGPLRGVTLSGTLRLRADRRGNLAGALEDVKGVIPVTGNLLPGGRIALRLKLGPNQFVRALGAVLSGRLADGRLTLEARGDVQTGAGSGAPVVGSFGMTGSDPAAVHPNATGSGGPAVAVGARFQPMGFSATVRRGPDAGVSLAGVLTLGPVGRGGILSGTLQDARLGAVPVTGRLVGSTVRLRFNLGARGVLEGVGPVVTRGSGAGGSVLAVTALGTLSGLRPGNSGDWDVSPLSSQNLQGASLYGMYAPPGTVFFNTDFSRADLRLAVLEGVIFINSRLDSAKLINARLAGASFYNTSLQSAHLGEADLTSAFLSGANLSSAVLGDAKLRSADLSGANLRSAFARYAGFQGANLKQANLQLADVNGADLSGADLSGAVVGADELTDTLTRFRDVNLRNARLRGTDFGGKFARTGTDLSGADLRGADLAGASLSFSVVKNANLSGLDLTSTKLSAVDFSGSDLSGARFAPGAMLGGPDFTNAKLRNVDFHGFNFSYTRLLGADLSGSDLRGTELSYADLRYAYLARTAIDANTRFPDLVRTAWELLNQGGAGRNLAGANLRNFDLRGADLRGADLRGADLRGTNLEGANLSGASLVSATLGNATFRNANMAGADVGLTDVSGLDFSGANLTGARFHGSKARFTDFSRANLTNAVMTQIYDILGSSFRSATLRGADFRGTLLISRGTTNDPLANDLTGADLTGIVLDPGRTL